MMVTDEHMQVRKRDEDETWVDQDTIALCGVRPKYEDGFVAWLNGECIAADNEPELPIWNSSSTASRSDSLAEQREPYSVDFAGTLQSGIWRMEG